MKFKYGKHAGEDVENVPMSYLWTLWENQMKEGPLKEAVRNRIEPDRYDLRLNDERTPSLQETIALAKAVFDRF